MNNEQQILSSWSANAQNWIDLIGSNGIESRKLATNQAIIDAVMRLSPASVLDLGCGEGWLSKILQQKGIEISGIDAIPALVEKARQDIPGEFFVATYDDIADGSFVFPGKYDVIVINFALIAKESTEKLLSVLPRYLSPGGCLLIQTLHPHARKTSGDYTSGWKEGSWDGLGTAFTQPYQWYFRTLEDWLQLLRDSGFTSVESHDVLHPQSGSPLSVIFESRLS